MSVNGRVVGSSLIGQSFSHPVIGKNGKPELNEEGEEVLAPDKAYFQPRPSPDRLLRQCHLLQQRSAPTASKRAKRCANTSPPTSTLEKPYDHIADQGPDPGRRGDRIGLRRRPGNLAGQRLDPGPPDRRGPPPSPGARSTPDLRPHQRPLPRRVRRARRQRPRNSTSPSTRKHRSNDHETQARSLFDPEILRPALIESLRKLDPRVQVRNPVMFVVEIGALITTVAWLIQVFGGSPLGGGHEPAWFSFSISIWLWLTVVFANMAEALAEGRGRAQAASLRAMRTETTARLRDGGEKPAAELVRGDVVVVEAGETIPGDGTVIEGIASVDESAITGESAPVIREAGGDRSAVTGGTKVLSDRIVVEITQEPGKSFLDRMIALVEGAERRKTPNEIALGILLAALTLIFIIVVVSLAPLRSVRRHPALGDDADRPPRRADPDHDRSAALGDRDRRHGPARAPQCARPLRPRGRGLRRLRRAPARQDRDDHPRQPRGDRVHPDAGSHRGRAGRGGADVLARRRDPRGALDRRPRQGFGIREHDFAGHEPTFVPFTAQTRMSGVDFNGTRLRKGAGDAIEDWVAEEGGRAPAELQAELDRIGREGGTPLAVARNERVLGVIYLKDIVKEGMKVRFDQLRAMGIRTIMVTGDNKLTAAKIAEEAGVDDFLAEATPERKLELIKEQQSDGRLIAMTGDGTNDAPALAQADVGVAMNTGTQAAREAGNMVDLDSNPTKLIEIVEVGKQLLITRGALTTFSIANDVAKYFAILPAMFAADLGRGGTSRARWTRST